MKINRLETHDRLLHLKKDQEINVFKGAEDCLKINKLSLQYQEKSPYVYIFAFPKTNEYGHPEMYWQPRLSRPTAQTNSYLFRATSKTDIIEVCWLIPPREQWPMFQGSNMMKDELVIWSVNQFRHKRKELEAPHPEDMPEHQMTAILKVIIEEHKQHKKDIADFSEIMPSPSEGFSL